MLLSSAIDRYEAEERQLLKKFLAEGMSVFEIGASIGVVSSIVAERVGPSGSLVSVEASSEIGAHTKSWLEPKYPWSQILIGAGLPIWDSSKTGLTATGFDGSRGSLGGKVIFRKSGRQQADPSSPVGVGIWDIRQLSEKAKLPVDALIVDIEGGEEQILGQEAKFPESLMWIMIELHPSRYEHESSRQALLDFFEAQGFEVFSSLGESFLFRKKRE
jgi:FkbM family methyltransferase